MKKIFLVTLFNLLFAMSAFAADGDLDTSFGAGGTVVETFYDALSVNSSVAIQADGKIVVAGYSTVLSTGQTDFTIVRYNTNGTVDATFGTNGKVYADVGGKSDQFPEVFVLQDGKILLAGQSRNAQDIPVISFFRFNSNGAIDTTFGTNGVAISSFTTSGIRGDVLGDAIVQTDGKIVVTGQWEGTSFCIGRFNANGLLDTTFAVNGNRCAQTNPLGTGLMRSLTLQADGKIIVAGRHQTSFTVPSDFIVFRFDTNGNLDTSFDGDGYAITDINSNYDEAYSVHVLTDGKILATGRAGISSSTQYSFGAVRYNTSGALDATFDGDGKATAFARNTAGSEKYASVVMTNGKIVVARHVSPSSGFFDDGQIMRFNENGSVDTSFGSGGQVLVTSVRIINALARQADGKIIAVGLGKDVKAYTLRYTNTDSAPPVNNPALRVADFDGDGKTDASVYRNGTWYINPSGSATAFAPQGFYGVQFGLATDKPAPADYDGDGKTDIAVFRENTGNPDRSFFYILNSTNNTVRAEQFGREGDNPTVTGDWDGDGKADLAVYRNGAQGNQSYFFYRPSAQSSVDFVALSWGAGGDEAVRGDFDGDGRLDAAVFRASNQAWYILQSSTNQARYDSWGLATDTRISGDFDGDGKTDLAVFRNGIWYIKKSSDNQPLYLQWGVASDKLVAGDYDGDRKTDVAVWRDGIYYVLQSTNSQPGYIYFGTTNDIPVASVFVQ